MKVKMCSFVLMLVLIIFTFAGCSGKTEPTPTSDNSGGTTAQTAGQTPTGEQRSMRTMDCFIPPLLKICMACIEYLYHEGSETM